MEAAMKTLYVFNTLFRIIQECGELVDGVRHPDQLSLRAAASRLGITPSALSRVMRQLNERLAVRWLHRATHSGSLRHADA
jgi:NTP pyrophosphatase (non-canonical NTP hydrolase)